MSINMERRTLLSDQESAEDDRSIRESESGGGGIELRDLSSNRDEARTPSASEDSSNPPPPPPSSSPSWFKMDHLSIFLLTMINFLFWFSFSIFIPLLPVINSIFTIYENRLDVNTTLAIFTGPFFIRPLGGILCGVLGDLYGRKKPLVLSTFVMAIANFSLGVLPASLEAKSAIPVFTFLRLLQGIAIGGGFIALLLLNLEMIPMKRRGLWGGIIFATGVLGYVAARAFASLLTHNFEPSFMAEWGWRIPFFLGSSIAPLGFILFFVCEESPVFVRNRSSNGLSKNPLFEIATEFYIEVALVAGVTVLWCSGVWILLIWLPTYIVDIASNPTSHVDAISFSSQMYFVFALVLFGYIGDRRGRLDVMFLGTLILSGLLVLLFYLLGFGKVSTALISSFCLFTLLACIGGSCPAWMVESFPASLRATALGIGYNLSQAAFGGTAPMVATSLIYQTGWEVSPAFFLCFVALGSGSALILAKRMAPVPRFLDLDRN